MDRREIFLELLDLQNIFLIDVIAIHKFHSDFVYKIKNDNRHEFNSELYIDGLRTLRHNPSFVWDDFQFTFAESVVCSIKELREKISVSSENLKESEDYKRLLLLGHDYLRYEIYLKERKGE